MIVNIYAQIAAKIIAEQETIIGPVAIEQAKRVNHLQLDWPQRQVTIDEDNGTAVLEALIEVYEELFGQMSVEVSRQAAAPLIKQLPANQRPAALK